VRHLRHARVTGREDPEHLDEDLDRQVGATVLVRHGDREEARGREAVELALGEQPVAVALERRGGELGGDLRGDLERLVAGQDRDGDRGHRARTSHLRGGGRCGRRAHLNSFTQTLSIL
jgi:hypothetical protein